MSNEEFKELMGLNKHFENINIILPHSGTKSKPIKILSDATKDIFFLDIDRRDTITFTRKKFQERHHNTNTVMVRLELDCRPHMYADGHLSSRNHIHVFDEDGMKTYDIDGEYAIIFNDIDDFNSVFFDFCNYCNISTEQVNVQEVI